MATHPKKNASHVDVIARDPNAPSHVADAENRTGKDDKPKKNTCPHCKTFHCKKPHQVKPDKCMWNKKHKGYCFKMICDKLQVVFKPCHKLSAELGGYTSKSNESGDN
jgi:hypothetical protein